MSQITDPEALAIVDQRLRRLCRAVRSILVLGQELEQLSANMPALFPVDGVIDNRPEAPSRTGAEVLTLRTKISSIRGAPDGIAGDAELVALVYKFAAVNPPSVIGLE